MGTIRSRTSPEMLRLAILAAIAVVAHSQLEILGAGDSEIIDIIDWILDRKCIDVINTYICKVIAKSGHCDAYPDYMKYACAQSCRYCGKRQAGPLRQEEQLRRPGVNQRFNKPMRYGLRVKG